MRIYDRVMQFCEKCFYDEEYFICINLLKTLAMDKMNDKDMANLYASLGECFEAIGNSKTALACYIIAREYNHFELYSYKENLLRIKQDFTTKEYFRYINSKNFVYEELLKNNIPLVQIKKAS